MLQLGIQATVGEDLRCKTIGIGNPTSNRKLVI